MSYFFTYFLFKFVFSFLQLSRLPPICQLYPNSYNELFFYLFPVQVCIFFSSAFSPPSYLPALPQQFTHRNSHCLLSYLTLYCTYRHCHAEYKRKEETKYD
nr:MAG TPA: hypothetical protein [Caudoviricetes sp.]